MRVIAGTLGGRTIRAPQGRGTRPTSDRVREAIFSMLGDLGGAHVLDLFAGSGALAIEAISRGAAHAVMVECDAGAARVIRANLDALGLDGDAAEVRRTDALAALRSALAAQETYDLLFIDPPYERARDLAAGLSANLPAVIAPGGRVVVESDRRSPMALDMPVDRERRYGDTSITIHILR